MSCTVLTVLQAAIPFSVVGSNATVEVNGKKVRGRVYPWGIVEGQSSILHLLFSTFIKTLFVHRLQGICIPAFQWTTQITATS
jgi:septin family protein